MSPEVVDARSKLKIANEASPDCTTLRVVGYSPTEQVSGVLLPPTEPQQTMKIERSVAGIPRSMLGKV